MRLPRRAIILAIATGMVACGGEGGDDASSGSGAATILVLAAASLTDAFTELSGAFEASHPGTTVELSFGASSSLREQLLAGAPADVFASADLANLQAVVDEGLASDARPFATNQLQIAVPAGNPGGVEGLDDFADPGLLIGLCAEEVPCGRYGREALVGAGVAASLDTNAPDVRALLTQLGSGDLDAGIVYETDVRAAGDNIEGIDIPDEQNVIAEYPIAALTGSSHAAVASAFVEFVLSSEGLGILAAHGFGAP